MPYRRFSVLQAGGDFHVNDHANGLMGVIGKPSAGRLAEYAEVLDASALDAAWKWEQILNAFPGETEAHLRGQQLNLV